MARKTIAQLKEDHQRKIEEIQLAHAKNVQQLMSSHSDELNALEEEQAEEVNELERVYRKSAEYQVGVQKAETERVKNELDKCQAALDEQRRITDKLFSNFAIGVVANRR